MKCFVNMFTAAALCLATILFGGCGDGGRKAQVDVAALNAALAVRETALLERLAELRPDEVAKALSWITETAGEGDRIALELTEDDLDAELALASTLGRFRKDAGGIVADVGNAARAIAALRQEAKRANDSMAQITNMLASGDMALFLGNFADEKRETEQLLAGWRKQRLAKMERGETATFPTFSAGAAEFYSAWETWASHAASRQRMVLSDYLPRVHETSSNLLAIATDAKRKSALAADAISKLRALPADASLVEAARKEALSTWDGPVQEAAKAMSAWSKDEWDCKATEQPRADKLVSRADALEKDVIDFSGAHERYLPRQDRHDAKTACGKAQEAGKKALSEINAYESEMDKLLEDWKTVEDVFRSTEKSAAWIRGMTKIDEETLTKHMAEIETFRLRLEKFNAVKRRANMSEMRENARSQLKEQEIALENAEKNFAAAKEKALADEKKARWEAEKEKLRASLTKIKGTLEAAPPPGFTRPDGESRALLTSLNNLLARIDTIAEDSLRAEVAKAEAAFGKIEKQTKWTPGSRHPTKPHIFAMEKENMWDADPGYWFDHPGEHSDLVVSWRPGQRHPNHPNISAGQTEDSWVPDPGYKARWNGDLDPVWTIGERHPGKPHIFASRENGNNVWDSDPGYVFINPGKNSDLAVRWKPGLRHPNYEGIESSQEEGQWQTFPGWTWVYPGTSNLQARWAPGSRHPTHPHIHASNEKWKWTPDDGYVAANSGSLDVIWQPGSWHSRHNGVIASRQEGYWEAAAGWEFVMAGPTERSASSDLRAKWMPGTWHPTQRHVYASQTENHWLCEDGYTYVNSGGSDLTVKWTPGWISPDGERRAKYQEGRFERKHDCPSCDNGWKTKSQRCDACRGTGKVMFGLPCPGCNGNGRVQTRYRCTSCDGIGWKWR